MLLSKNLLTETQTAAVDRLFEEDATLLVAGTGVGKTAIALTAIAELIEAKHLKSVIVVAPAKVVEQKVWGREAVKWEHLNHLRVVSLVGNAQEREALIDESAEVHIVSLNNLAWLLERGTKWADGVVVDELSKAAGKQARGLRGKKKAGHLIFRVGLTATPVAQDFLKLFDMARILDGGAALGTNKSVFTDAYFESDFMGYNITIRPGAAEMILHRMRGLVHVVDVDKADTLPPIKFKVLGFGMPAKTLEIYDEMKSELIVGDVVAANAAVMHGKLRQIASGFAYDEVGEVVRYDTAREDALRKLLLRCPPALVFYEYVEQGVQVERAIADTGSRAAQINSMSHGVDGLQHEFSHVVFYHPVWSRDAWEQAYGRVWRTGQTSPVTVTTLMCDASLDDVVVARVEGRGEWMELFTTHLQGVNHD